MNYTSIEQSKKLLELGLSPESADIFIPCYGNDKYTEFRPYFREHVTKPDMGDLPCWSVGALLELMPKKIKKDDEKLPFHLFQFKDTWGVQYGYPNETEYAVLIENKTPLEAAYNMVVWLLENNYIKKEGNT